MQKMKYAKDGIRWRAIRRCIIWISHLFILLWIFKMGIWLREGVGRGATDMDRLPICHFKSALFCIHRSPQYWNLFAGIRNRQTINWVKPIFIHLFCKRLCISARSRPARPVRPASCCLLNEYCLFFILVFWFANAD